MTNICEGQRGVFLAAAGNPSITCEQAANGGGALATNALQTGGVSLYYSLIYVHVHVVHT